MDIEKAKLRTEVDALTKRVDAMWVQVETLGRRLEPPPAPAPAPVAAAEVVVQAPAPAPKPVNSLFKKRPAPAARTAPRWLKKKVPASVPAVKPESEKKPE